MTISPPLYAADIPSSPATKEVDRKQCVAVECACSHCQRHGSWAVHPLSRDVVFTRGVEHRGKYRCGSGKNPHYYCKRCGCYLATDLSWLMREVFGTEARMTVNLRMLKDFRPAELKVRKDETMKFMGGEYKLED